MGNYGSRNLPKIFTKSVAVFTKGINTLNEYLVYLKLLLSGYYRGKKTLRLPNLTNIAERKVCDIHTLMVLVLLWMRLSQNNAERNVCDFTKVAVFAIIKCSQQ